MRKVAIFGFIFLTFVVFFGVLSPSPSSAKRLLPQASKQKSSGTKVVSNTKGVMATVKIRADRRAIAATFSNLRIAKSIEYSLSYKTNGVAQSVMGRISPTDTEPRVEEVIFGTCSTNNVCRFDKNITNAKFVVTTTLLGEKKVIKTFTIKKV